MTEKLFHKGWLYERDGVRFVPFVLKESIVDREGKLGWANDVDIKLTELEDALINAGDSNSVQFEDLKERTENLELRTQYMNAEESNEFCITDGNGNIGFKVDDNGASSIDFITSTGIKLSEVKTDLDAEIVNRERQDEELNDAIAVNRDNITLLENRAQTLEIRTQFMNAEESDEFYITDGEGNIGLRVNNFGTTSYNFITNETDLNSLAERTGEIEDTISSIQGESLVNLQNQIIKLQERTKYMDASQNSSAFYITDGKGNIAAIIDGRGVTSFNFISHGVTDLNSLYRELRNQGITIKEIQDSIAEINNDIAVVEGRTTALEVRTKYMDASDEDDTFYITDYAGNVIMKVDNLGVHSVEFNADGIQLKAAIEELFAEDTNIIDAISELTSRASALELRTKFLDASEEDDTFYITDGNGKIGFKVDNNGSTSIDFITSSGIKLSEVKANLDKEIQDRTIAIQNLEKRDTELSDSITDVNNTLNDKIDTTKTELTNLVETTRAGLQQNLDSVEADLNQKITQLSNDVQEKDKELADTIDSTKTELTTLISDTKSELKNDISQLDSTLNNKIDTTKNQLEQSINQLEEYVVNSDTEIQDELSKVAGRTETLEIRTQYMNAEESNEFCVTDENGNVGFRVDDNGATSIDFTTSEGIKLSEVKAGLDKEIADRTKDISDLVAKDNELSDTIDDLNIKINDRITEVNNTLDAKIDKTKEDLQTEIGSTKTELNTTISNLADRLDLKDGELNDAISNNQIEIVGLKNRMDTAEYDIDQLELNSATKVELTENVKVINNKLQEHTEAIDAINNLDEQQNDILSDLTPRMTAVETRTQFMDASAPDAFYITDENGNIGFVFDSNGVLSTLYRMKATDKTVLPLIGYQKTNTITID